MYALILPLKPSGSPRQSSPSSLKCNSRRRFTVWLKVPPSGHRRAVQHSGAGFSPLVRLEWQAEVCFSSYRRADWRRLALAWPVITLITWENDNNTGSLMTEVIVVEVPRYAAAAWWMTTTMHRSVRRLSLHGCYLNPFVMVATFFFFLWGCLAEGKWLDFREEKFPCEWGKKNVFIDESRGVWKSTACVPVLFCLRTWMVPYKHTHKVLKSVVKEPKRPQYADFNLLIIQNVDRRVFTAHRLVDFCIHWRHSTHKSLFMAVNLHDKYNQNALSRNRKLEWQLI